MQYNHVAQFYACPVNDNGEYNLYTTPVSGQTKCVGITLNTGGRCVSAGGQASASSPGVSNGPVGSSYIFQPVTYQSSTSSPTPGFTKSSALVTASEQSSVPAQASSGSSPAPGPTLTEGSVLVVGPTPSEESASLPATALSKSSVAAPSPTTSQGSASAPIPTAPQGSASASPSSPPSGSVGKCPADLKGNYQYPHLIIPINSSQPSTAPGTSYFGQVSSTICSIFNFDIPQSYSGQKCSLVFLFPQQLQLETSSYTISGSGGVEFSKLGSSVSQQTSWSNCPAKESNYGTLDIQPGNSYTIWSGSCPAGQTVAYKMCGTGSLNLRYFQDYNPSPIGLYMR